MTVSLPGEPVPMPAHVVDRAGGGRLGLPRQRAAARRPRRAGVGPARGAPRPGRGLGARRGAGHPRRAGSRQPRPRAGSASSRRSAAGSRTSAAPPTVTAARRHRVGARRSPRVSRPVTIHSDHPFADPDARPGTPVPRPARRRGDALDGRGRAGPRRADGHVGAGRRRRAGPGAGAARPRLPTSRAAARRPDGPSSSAVLGATATWPRRSPGRRRRRAGAFRLAAFGTDPWGPRLDVAPRPGRASRSSRRRSVGWSSLVTCVVDEVARRRRRGAGAPARPLSPASGLSGGWPR